MATTIVFLPFALSLFHLPEEFFQRLLVSRLAENVLNHGNEFRITALLIVQSSEGPSGRVPMMLQCFIHRRRNNPVR